jgi:hypothetical protein
MATGWPGEDGFTTRLGNNDLREGEMLEVGGKAKRGSETVEIEVGLPAQL